MEYTNAQILASVLSQWARPAISQIAASKLSGLPIIANANNSLVKSGLVGSTYNIINELTPFLHNGIETLVVPFLNAWLSKIPDASIPALAHSVVDTAMTQPKFSILDGLITFEDTDILELKELLDKNLPISQQTYKVLT